MEPPPDTVLAAFELSGEAVLLPGGQGETWRVGGVVLKPVGFVAEAVWRAEVLAGLPEGLGFRVARPVRARSGAWVVDGWEAGELLAGATDVGRPDDVLRAGAAFHETLAALPRPAFLDVRDNPWTYGDRVAWAEQPAGGSPAYQELVGALFEARRPIASTAQVVHGDLLGNVMFADGLSPAIIDWPVYWRPPAWAAAVAVVDALCWYDARPELAARWAHLPEWGQMLVRALIYRITTDDAARGPAVWTAAHRDAYQTAIDVALGYTR
ncbi:TIGR02569 family protein [Sorangium sp. So ce385]|uniref:TIGR02569 family protein n=1 Tax=Sorangium sp. So ce385 TaxID=3133308 RepID=UPI003F5C75E9